MSQTSQVFHSQFFSEKYPQVMKSNSWWVIYFNSHPFFVSCCHAVMLCWPEKKRGWFLGRWENLLKLDFLLYLFQSHVEKHVQVLWMKMRMDWNFFAAVQCLNSVRFCKGWFLKSIILIKNLTQKRGHIKSEYKYSCCQWCLELIEVMKLICRTGPPIDFFWNRK